MEIKFAILGTSGNNDKLSIISKFDDLYPMATFNYLHPYVTKSTNL